MSIQLCRPSRFRETVLPLFMVVLMSSACDGLGVSTSAPDDPNVRVLTLEERAEGGAIPVSASANFRDESLPLLTRIVGSDGKIISESLSTADQVKSAVKARLSRLMQMTESPTPELDAKLLRMRSQDPEAWSQLMSALPKEFAKQIEMSLDRGGK